MLYRRLMTTLWEKCYAARVFFFFFSSLVIRASKTNFAALSDFCLFLLMGLDVSFYVISGLDMFEGIALFAPVKSTGMAFIPGLW